MACISSDGLNQVAVSCGNILKVIDISTNSVLLSFKNELMPSKEKEERSCDFICHGFSKDCRFFAALTEDKKLLIWATKEKCLDCSYCLPKRPTCFDFCNNEDTIVVADKYGDIYKCGYKSTKNTGPTLLLGHLSMVLVVKMTINDKFIISADRDEKIRISSYPNAYSIHSYCMGHQNLVSSLSLLDDGKLLSSSADSTIKLWDYKAGIELQSTSVAATLQEKPFLISNIAYHGNTVCAIGESSCSLMIFKYSDNALSLLSTHNLPGVPFGLTFIKSDLVVLVKHTEKPIVILEKKCGSDEYIVKDDCFDYKELGINTGSICESNYLTHLVKPVKGKRASEVISPETTINYEGAYKMQKLNTTENIMEE